MNYDSEIVSAIIDVMTSLGFEVHPTKQSHWLEPYRGLEIRSRNIVRWTIDALRKLEKDGVEINGEVIRSALKRAISDHIPSLRNNPWDDFEEDFLGEIT